MLRLKMKGEQG